MQKVRRHFIFEISTAYRVTNSRLFQLVYNNTFSTFPSQYFFTIAKSTAMLFINWIIDNFDYLDCNILAIIVAVILAALIIMSSEFVINILFKRAAHNKLLLR